MIDLATATERIQAGLAAWRRAPWTAALAAAGEAGWLVGGCLRDLALGRAAPDIDLTVPPGAAFPLGRRLAADLGWRFVSLHEAFGSCRVVAPDGFWLDLTDWQAPTLEADLRRRDFTINALAVPWPAGEPLLDPTGGLADLAVGLIRRTSPGVLRDDPVRVVRAFRFAATFGFDLDADTLAEARELATLVPQSPGERIWEEWKHFFRQPHCAPALQSAIDAGLVDALFPELADGADLAQPDYHHLDVRGHNLAAALAVDDLLDDEDFAPVLADPDARLMVRLAALLHDVGKADTAVQKPDDRIRFPAHATAGAAQIAGVAARLRQSNLEKRRLARLVGAHMRPHQLSDLLAAGHLTARAARKFLVDLDEDWALCLALARADLRATAGPGAPTAGETRARALHAQLREFAIRHRDIVRAPLVRGEDVLALGVPPGPAVQDLLDAVAEARFARPDLTRDAALALLRERAATLGYIDE